MVPIRFLIAAVALGAMGVNAKLFADAAAWRRLKVEAGVTPIAKVLTLLQEMAAKGHAAKQEEQTKFAAFSVWCEGTRTRKKGEVAVGTDLMAKQQAKIQKAVSHIKRATARAHELEEDVGRWKKDQNSASTVRSMEKADYTATAADYSESLDALAGAIETLKKQDVDRPQVDAALLQVQSKKLVPYHAKRTLAAFLQEADEILAASGESGTLP